ncbi:AMP-binding protein [Pseudomaricurvus alcaniphilus]|uniref:AMP-binding protein n=1 Tax=Pseudomaricurvus alcaniphilus TaxID=1166482 RepID=UPI00140BE30D|nr:AMP-binding protein [Pseudomaricurvus alcaniphilus]NHN36665.1 AMP-binding protein [Pseudomaricurvus alcaniphilus]
MDYVRFHSQLHPARMALTDLISARQWRYAELDHYIATCAALLAARGVSEGDRVACLAKNCAEIVVLHLACARLGALFVPLNWRLSAAELAVLVEDCQPTLIFFDGSVTELLPDAPAAATVAIDQLQSLCAQVEPVWPGHRSEDLPSLILYTSGTTGKPKGVMLSERNLTETAINFSLLGEVDSESVFLCESPMFHIIGMITSLRPVFLCGAQVMISDRFIPERTLARLADPQLGISHYFCVPQMAVALRAEPGFDAGKLRGLKALFTGGAPHPEAQIRDWLDVGISIVDGYGMSEAGTVFGMPLDRALIAAKAGCVGIPSPRIHARVVDEQNQPVDVGVPGELQLKGDNIAVGYWRRQEDYQNALTEDGWFCTGDVVALDADGYYRVTDRKKDMFISGGENVYPAEVEALLVKYPGIRELAVVGVPDEQWGEVGCLFYVTDGADLNPEQLLGSLTSQLAKYKIPKKTMALEALPRNSLGKVLKHELREKFSATAP